MTTVKRLKVLNRIQALYPKNILCEEPTKMKRLYTYFPSNRSGRLGPEMLK